MVSPSIRLFFGAVCLASAPILVKFLQHLGPSTIGFYRCSIAGFVLLILSFSVDQRKALSLASRPFWFGVFSTGLFFASDLALWHLSVFYCGTGLSTVVANTQVFYVAIFGLLCMKEKPNLLFLVSVPMAFVGIYLLVHFQSSHSPLFALGILYGLLAGAAYAGFIILLRQIEGWGKGVSSTLRLSLVSLASALFLFYFAALGKENSSASGQDWIWILLLACVAQVLGWVLIGHNLPKVPISRASLILLAQPVIATFPGSIFFGEHLSRWQLLGCGLTLLAIYMGNAKLPRYTPSRGTA